MVAIGEIFEVARGGSPRPIQNYFTDNEDGINWIMISDATASNKYITKTKQKIIPEGKHKSREVNSGDFLLTNSMSFGRPYILKTNGCIHDGWLLLRPRSKNLNQEFFYHFLGSPDVYKQFAARAPGSTVKNLNSDIVRETLVPLPPIEEQKRIAAILDQADELRRLRQRAIDRLNALGQAIFYEMFGDSSEGRYSVEPLDSLSESIDYGFTASATEEPIGPKLLRITDIQDGKVDWDTVPYCTAKKADISEKRLLAGDIVFARTGATTGKSFLITTCPEDSIFASYLIRVRPGKNLLPEFVASFFQTNDYWRQISLQANGAAQPGVNSTKLKELLLPLPPLSHQEKFKESYNRIASQKTLLEIDLVRHSALFSALQHRAFRGEL